MNRRFKLRMLGVIILLCSLSLTHAEIKKFKASPRTVTLKKWQVADFSFKAKANAKPFITEFYATFTSPSGKIQKVPGFYNGNNEWLLRFSGNEEGTWTYVTASALRALKNKKGKIKVTSQLAEAKHGGIIIPKDDVQHFYYEDGTPYFLMAYECDWLYSLDYHNDKALPKTDHLLNLMKKNGFNQVVMNVFTYDVNWKKDKALAKHPEFEYGGAKDIYPFLGNNEKPDFSSLNPEFFKKLDRTIDLMNEKDIVSHLMIYVWNKMVSWPNMNTEADNMYYDYVVKRYSAFPNIIWDVSKEALYYGRADAKYILGRIKRLRANDSFNRLMTVHDYGFCKKYSSEVDYISRQDWNYSLYKDMLSDKDTYKNKPVFNIEHGGYEQSRYEVFPGSYISAEECLRRNYQCAFAGVYSTYYWQGTSWNVLIYNPFEQPASFYKPKFQYFKYFTKLFTEKTFKDYKPMPRLNQAGYCLKHKDKEDYMFYVPKETFQYRAAFLFKDKKMVHYKWFNTLTGEYSQEKTLTKNVSFRCPWYERADAVLLAWK